MSRSGSRRKRDEQVERFRYSQAKVEADALKADLEEWASESIDSLRTILPDLPAKLNDRAAEGWEPLLAIAELAGEAWPKKAAEAAVALCADVEIEDDSFGVQLLADIKRWATPTSRRPSSSTGIPTSRPIAKPLLGLPNGGEKPLRSSSRYHRWYHAALLIDTGPVRARFRSGFGGIQAPVATTRLGTECALRFRPCELRKLGVASWSRQSDLGEIG